MHLPPNVHFCPVLTKPDSLIPSVCYQVAACQRDKKHHVGATNVSVKVRALTKKADTVGNLRSLQRGFAWLKNQQLLTR